MKHEFTTIKVWAETRKLLRLIAALTGESLVEVIHRLATEEAAQKMASDPCIDKSRCSHDG